MEEADALCTKIGIVAGGQLKCLGSQLHLKHKFGSGYRLNVQFASVEQNDDFMATEISPLIKLGTYIYIILSSFDCK